MLVSSLRKSRPLNTWTGSQCFSETKERALIRWVRLAGRITAISVKRRGDWHSPSEPKDTCPVLKSLNRKATSGHIYDRHFPGLGDKKNEISRHRRRVSTRRVVFYDRQRFIATVHGKFGLLKIYCFKARIVKKISCVQLVHCPGKRWMIFFQLTKFLILLSDTVILSYERFQEEWYNWLYRSRLICYFY